MTARDYRTNAAEDVFDAELQDEWQHAREHGHGIDVDAAELAALRALGILPDAPQRPRFRRLPPPMFYKSWLQRLLELLLGE